MKISLYMCGSVVDQQQLWTPISRPRGATTCDPIAYAHAKTGSILKGAGGGRGAFWPLPAVRVPPRPKPAVRPPQWPSRAGGLQTEIPQWFQWRIGAMVPDSKLSFVFNGTPGAGAGCRLRN
jgi:hypothetical protein